MLKVIFVGDIYGNLGRKTFQSVYKKLKKEFEPDFCVANVENAANGKGTTWPVLNELFNNGVDVATSGNHIWSNTGVFNFIEDEKRMVIPANLYDGVPGHRFSVVEKNGKKLGVISVMGNVFMNGSSCPFRAVDYYLPEIKEKTKCVVVDFHAEATAEKIALAWHLEGRVSAVIGTHTHVQTADERILPFGTAVMCDAGMTGPRDGIIGANVDIVLRRFKYNYPERLEPAKGAGQFNGVYLEIDEESGQCLKIQRIEEYCQ